VDELVRSRSTAIRGSGPAARETTGITPIAPGVMAAVNAAIINAVLLLT
jgi:hypothetical protein